MSDPEVPPPSEERAHEKEYTPEDIADLLYWSFEAVQGSPGRLRENVYTLLLKKNPHLAQAVGAWREHIGTDELIWKEDPVIVDLAKRVMDRRNSESHAAHNQKVDLDSALRQVYMELRALFSTQAHASEPKGETKADPLWAFVFNTAEHDVALEGRPRVGLAEARAKVGGSRLCFYGLSKDREKHFNNLETVVPREEIRQLWRDAGDYVRDNYASLGTTTKKAVDAAITLYEQKTGDKLKLGT